MLEPDKVKLDELYQQAFSIEKDKELEEEKAKQSRLKFLAKRKKFHKNVNILRKREWAHLLENAEAIFYWVKELGQDTKGKKLVSILKEIIVYEGYYLRFMATDKESSYAWLVVSCENELLFRWFTYGHAIEGDKKIISPVQMVKQLHPHFINSAWDSIKTGGVWENTEKSIKFAARIINARHQSGEVHY